MNPVHVHIEPKMYLASWGIDLSEPGGLTEVRLVLVISMAVVGG